MTSILKEIYSKCFALENDISNEITKIIDNTFPINTIDRVKQKIKESLENYNNSIELLNMSIEKGKISKEQKDFWKKKAEYFISSRKNLIKRLEDCVYNIKKKNQRYKLNFDDDNNLEFGQNINNLEREKQSLISTLKMTTEIEANSINVNNELSNQLLSLSNIGGKINQIFQKMTGSYKDSSWIKQRGQNDKYLCLALGCLTIFIIGFTYLYLRPKIRGK
jgi:DNA repair exonuclease SbcCD ATPase subunit